MALPHKATLEALLFAAGEPLSRKRLTGLMEVSMEEVDSAIQELSESLSESGLSLVDAGDEVELRTAAGAAEAVTRLRESELSRDIGKASLETLAFILYKGGATRGEIDWVRGVNSGAAIRSLLMRGLIERTEAEDDKRKAFYKATIDALSHLGVARKEDLPRYAELAASLREEEARAGSQPE